jgi:hypothetical protein
VPTDENVGLAVAALRCLCSAGPQRTEGLTELRWVPTRWQLADPLTKPKLEKLMLLRMRCPTARLREESAAKVRKGRMINEVSCDSPQSDISSDHAVSCEHV